jgi:transposase
MHKDTLLFIGLDTHKESTDAAYVNGERGSSVAHYGKIPTTKPALVKLARQFVSKYPGKKGTDLFFI